MNTKQKKQALPEELLAAITEVIETHNLLRSSIELHPKQLPRAGTTAKVVEKVSQSIEILETVFDNVVAQS